MSNVTNASANADLAMLVGASGYSILGFIYGSCNLIIGLSVLKYSALRQYNQYILLMSLAFADAGTMYGYCGAGIYRLWLWSTNRLGTLVTPLQCLAKPHVFLWLSAYPFSSLMLVILSIDRLFLVSFPSVYILCLPSPTYAYALVFTGLGLILALALLGLLSVFTMPAAPILNAICYMPLTPKDPNTVTLIFIYYFERASYLALGSVAIFVAVPVVSKLRSNDIAPDERERHDRMTKTVAVSCLCTLFLYSVPNRLGYMAYNEGHRLLARVLWLVSMGNGFANVVIYQLRHFEMRVALKALLKWKTLPDNLTVWPKPTDQTPVVQSTGRMFQIINRPGNSRVAEQVHVEIENI